MKKQLLILTILITSAGSLHAMHAEIHLPFGMNLQSARERAQHSLFENPEDMIGSGGDTDRGYIGTRDFWNQEQIEEEARNVARTGNIGIDEARYILQRQAFVNYFAILASRGMRVQDLFIRFYMVDGNIRYPYSYVNNVLSIHSPDPYFDVQDDAIRNVLGSARASEERQRLKLLLDNYANHLGRLNPVSIRTWPYDATIPHYLEKATDVTLDADIDAIIAQLRKMIDVETKSQEFWAKKMVLRPLKAIRRGIHTEFNNCIIDSRATLFKEAQELLANSYLPNSDRQELTTEIEQLLQTDHLTQAERDSFVAALSRNETGGNEPALAVTPLVRPQPRAPRSAAQEAADKALAEEMGTGGGEE